MGINPNDLDRIRQLSIDHLRGWMSGQKPDSRYHQVVKNALARRENQTAWIKWGLLSFADKTAASAGIISRVRTA